MVKIKSSVKVSQAITGEVIRLMFTSNTREVIRLIFLMFTSNVSAQVSGLCTQVADHCSLGIRINESALGSLPKCFLSLPGNNYQC